MSHIPKIYKGGGMKTLNFWNVKGGVGKSSLALLTGEILLGSGSRVLFLDSDPQKSVTKTILETQSDSPTLFDVLMKRVKIQDAIVESKGFAICPGSLDLLKIQESIIQNAIESELAEVSKDFDYCIIDNQPTWNSIVRANIQACDRIIMPAMVSIFDLDEVRFSIREARLVRPNVDISIVLNGVGSADKITADESEYMDAFLDEFKNELAMHRIPRSIVVKKIIDRGENLLGKGAAKEKFRSALVSMVSEITSSKIKLREVA
jgi:chromosome partitioning protein